MSDFVEVDVRGPSCPEPVLMVMDAMDEHPGKQIRVLGDEAHTRTLEYHGKEGHTEVLENGCFTITFEA